MMIRAANLITETRRVPGMAGTSAITPDWSPVRAADQGRGTDDWNDKVAADRFAGKGGHLVRGQREDHRRRPGDGDRCRGEPGSFWRARAIVINTGTDPVIPPLEGLADTP